MLKWRPWLGIGATLFILILLLQAAIHAAIGTKWFFSDEQAFTTYGWLLTKGVLEHRDLLSIRPPLMGFIGWLSFSLLGPSMSSIRLVMLIAGLCSTSLVAYLAYRGFGKTVALLAALLYVVLEPAFLGFQFLADPFIILFSLAALALSYEYLDKRRHCCLLFFAGIMLGLGISARQSGLWGSAGIAAGIAFAGYSKGKSLKGIAADIGLVACGIAAPIACIAAYYYLNGALQQLVQDVATGPAALSAGAAGKLMRLEVGWLERLYLVALLPLAYYARTFARKKRDSRWLAGLLLLSFTFPALLGFFPNLSYFHLMPALPALCIACAAMLVWLCDGFSRGKMRAGGIAIGAAVFASVLLLAVLSQILIFNDGLLPFYPERCNTAGIYAIAQTIRENSAENETIMCFPHFPLYFLAGRMPSSKYFSTSFDLAGLAPEDSLVRDMEAKQTRYVVYVNYSGGYSLASYAPSADAYVKSSFRPVQEESVCYLNFSLLERN